MLVQKCGSRREKFTVPSSGSIIHTGCSAGSVPPPSSPNTACSGNACNSTAADSLLAIHVRLQFNVVPARFTHDQRAVIMPGAALARDARGGDGHLEIFGHRSPLPAVLSASSDSVRILILLSFSLSFFIGAFCLHLTGRVKQDDRYRRYTGIHAHLDSRTGINLLVLDTATVFAAGLLFALLARRMRQSLLLGYLVAGLVIGPHGLALVRDQANIRFLAEVGVVLLMFALGAQLSLRQLLEVRGPALGVGVLQCVIIVLLGVLIGRVLGLSFERRDWCWGMRWR